MLSQWKVRLILACQRGNFRQQLSPLSAQRSVVSHHYLSNLPTVLNTIYATSPDMSCLFAWVDSGRRWFVRRRQHTFRRPLSAARRVNPRRHLITRSWPTGSYVVEVADDCMGLVRQMVYLPLEHVAAGFMRGVSLRWLEGAPR